MRRVFFNVNIWSMTRDPTAIGNIPALSGILSNLGALLWCTTASICYFAGIAFRNLLPRKVYRFFICSAILTTYLLFDDLFQIHETIALHGLTKNVDLIEKFFYSVLGIIVLLYFFTYRRVILRTQYVILILAVIFFSASVFFDNIIDAWILEKVLGRSLHDWFYFFEDGFKWLGIACWCSYFVHTSYQLLINSLRLPSDSGQ